MSENIPNVVPFRRENLTLTRDGKPRCVVLGSSILKVYREREQDKGKKEDELEGLGNVEYSWRCTLSAKASVESIKSALKCIDEKFQSERLTKFANDKSESEYLRDIATICIAVTQWEEERQRQSANTPKPPSVTSESQSSRATTPTPAPLPKTPTKQTPPRTPLSSVSVAAPLSSFGNLLWKNLGSNDIKSGWLYVFSIESLEGYYKLGYTTVNITDVRDRLRSHLKCYKEINVVALIGIDNVARYEQLIFKSLSQCQRSFECPHAHRPKRHREWLQIDKQSLLEAIYSWQRLSVAGLYSPDGKANQAFLQSTSPKSPSVVDEVLNEYHYSRLFTPKSKPRSAKDLSSDFANLSMNKSLRSPSRAGDDDDDEEGEDAVGQSSPSLRKQKDIKTTEPRRRPTRLMVKEELAY
ncbi:hypothetical protein P168DRAFT_333765 [Aspergillus campestris IBT 28561]|uniref:Bacteriophage T5 Orf172 DNA-binding domain-containing protein n=1 Tax=Aspergillus campestris (strain IBT 28561) TaxID=1392248 RepID=A0A2I1CXG5_ASPC2|nr:uncharacterized protein P168DRAFT_333765 [Aspergillus campestris IBT 28561]PKY02312.1 hypothetical protein P168DRAFT_333765 [Aspergillus campestris IBT 28561]